MILARVAKSVLVGYDYEARRSLPLTDDQRRS